MAKFLGLAVLLAVVGGFLVWDRNDNWLSDPLPQTLEVKSKPLDKYTIEALSKTKFEASEITLGRVLNETANFTSYVFYFTVNPSTHSVNTQGRTEWNRSTTGSGPRKVSGLVNVPKALRQAQDKLREYPVILMFRGYVDREVYTTGVGTQRAAEVFAKNGFITIAPDFLGYGESDKPSDNPMEERFQTYITVLTLLSSFDRLNEAFQEKSIDVQADTSQVGIWGHSNGGQIALTILEITNRAYPTVLWAPVSKPFPYSVLYYTDAAEDRGKLLRRVIAEFEKDYDVELYSLTNFFDRISAPLQIHQGVSDESVSQKWSDELVGELGKLEKDVEYFTYNNADHNLLPGGWNLAVLRGIDFYREKW